MLNCCFICRTVHFKGTVSRDFTIPDFFFQSMSSDNIVSFVFGRIIKLVNDDAECNLGTVRNMTKLDDRTVKDSWEGISSLQIIAERKSLRCKDDSDKSKESTACTYPRC